MIGKTISHYRILEKLGEGGMGVVYRAEDTKLGRCAALKFLSPTLTRDSQAVERFINEAKAASMLDHPNICTIYEIGETEEGQLFIAMAYCQGETLQQKVANGQLPVDSAIKIATQIASGLARAHEAGITHDDIKPTNIVITKRGEAKIVDWGLAKLSEQDHLPQTGSTIGTIAYMSPEQTQSLPVDHPALRDIWSLGVVMYEMLTGQLPFAGEFDQVVMYGIVNLDPPPVTKLNPEVPVALQRLVHKALQKNPGKRYQTTQDLLSDLQRARRGKRTKATVKTSKPKKLRKGLFAGSAVFTIIAAAILLRPVWFWDVPKTSTSAAVIANLPARLAIFPFTVRGSAKYAYLREAMVDLLHSKLDWAGNLRVVDPSKLLSYIAKDSVRRLDAEQASRMAQHFEAGLFVLGSIMETGGRLEMNASLYSVSEGLKFTTQTAIADETHLIEGVDALATKIIMEQSNNPTQHFTHDAGTTTKSFAALKAYLQGESKLRQHEADFTAREAFEQAVAYDSTFALAWFRLSFAALATNQTEQGYQAAERAAYWSRPLPKRKQQLLQANDMMIQGRFEVAERLYRAIVFAYPDDIEAWLGLGQTLFYYNPLQGRSIIESRPAFEQAALLDDGHLWAKIFLLNLAVVESNAAKVDSLMRLDMLRNSLQSPLYGEVCQALLRNDHALWQRAVEKLTNQGDFTVAATTFWATRAWLNGPVFHYDNLPEPAEIAHLLVTSSSRSPDYRALGYLYLAKLDLLYGKWQAAQTELQHLAALNAVWGKEYRALFCLMPFIQPKPPALEELRDELQRWDAKSVPASTEPFRTLAAHNGVHAHLRLYLLAMLSARLRQEKEARQYAIALLALPHSQRFGFLAQDLALSVRAELAQLHGQPAQALALLERQKMQVWYELAWGSPFFAQVLARFQRAELLQALGRYEEALNWYNTTVYYPPDWLLLAPNYLKRAEVYEKIGQRENAIEQYLRFIRLWEDCDPELRPIVDDAQRKLTSLQLKPFLRFQ